MGALVWLHLADDSVSPEELRRVAGDAEDFLWTAADGGALYGLPLWMAEPGIEVPENAAELAVSLTEVMKSIDRRQSATGPLRKQVIESHDGFSEEELRRLISATDPRERDLGWRQIRVDVPVTITMRDSTSAGLLIGLYADIDTGSAIDGVSAAGFSRTMAAEFQGGLDDGRRAAIGLLNRLGADQQLISPFRSIAVSALGLREPPPGQQEPLRGRSAGLPLALAILRRASELDGEQLPPPRYAATGCIDQGGELLEMDPSVVAAKLEAVESDGWHDGLICPPHSPDPRATAVKSATTLEEAAELTWGDRWRDWRERLYQNSKPQESLLGSIERYIERFERAPLERSGPPEVIRNWRTNNVKTREERDGKTGSGDAGSSTLGKLSLSSEGKGDQDSHKGQDDSGLNLALSAGEEEIEPADVPETLPAARSSLWDPFGFDEGHAILSGGSSDGHTELLRRHTEAWLEEARRPGRAELPLLCEAVALADSLAKTVSGESLPGAIASLLDVDPKGPEYAFIRGSVNDGGLVLAVDGWELVAENEGRRLATALSKLQAKGSRVVIADRGLDAANSAQAFPGLYTHNELTGLSDEEVESVVRGALETRADPFLSLRTRSPQFAELTRTLPLMQHLIAAAKKLNRADSMTRAALLRGALLDALEQDESALEAVAKACADTELSRGPVSRFSAQELRDAVISNEQRLSPAVKGGGEDSISKLLRSRVLVEEGLEEARELRFEHSVLQLTCVAIHLAQLPASQRWEALQNKSWSDPRRDAVIELCCGFAPDPEEIIARLLRDEEDYWDQRLTLTARCICEVGRRKFEPASSVISRLYEAIIVERPGAERRYLSGAIAALVEAKIEGAAEVAIKVIERPGLPHPVTVRLGESLARAGEVRGLNFLTDIAHEGSPRAVSSALDALAELDGSNAVLLLEGLMVSRRCLPNVVRRTAVLKRASKADLGRLAALLRDARITVPVRQALAAAIASVPSAHGISLAAGADIRVPWSVRATVASRLAVRSPLPAPLGKLVMSPNLTRDWRARLAMAMLAGGDRSALEMAIATLQGPLPAAERTALVEALATTSEGRVGLKRYVDQSSREWTGFPVTLSALVRAGDERAAEIAVALIADELVKSEVACRLLRALDDADYEGWETLAEKQLESSALAVEERLPLGMRLARASALREPAFRSLLLLEAGQGPLGPRGSLIEAQVISSGSWAQVENVIADRSLSLGQRNEVAAAACWAVKESARLELPASVLSFVEEEPLSRAQKSLLLTSIARTGNARNAERVVRTALKADLLSGKAFRGLIREVVSAAGHSALNPETRTQLAEAMGTAVERPQRKKAGSRRKLEERIGERIANYLNVAEAQLMDELIDEGEEDAVRDLIERMVPFYGEIVKEELELLDDSVEVSAPTNGETMPAVSEQLPAMTIDAFRMWTSILAIDPRDQNRSQEFIGTQSRPDPELESWLGGESLRWPEECAHRALLGNVSRYGLSTGYQAAFDSNALESGLRLRLEIGAGRELLDLAALLMMASRAPDGRSKGDPPTYFYGSLGAALSGQDALAIKLMAKCAELLLAESEKDERRRMVSEGIRTLGEVETLHGFDDVPCTATLQRVLRSASGKRHFSA